MAFVVVFGLGIHIYGVPSFHFIVVFRQSPSITVAPERGSWFGMPGDLVPDRDLPSAGFIGRSNPLWHAQQPPQNPVLE
jgi:hypothetical protein